MGIEFVGLGFQVQGAGLRLGVRILRVQDGLGVAMFDNSKPHARGERERERKSRRFSEQHESKVPSAARAARNARGRLSPVEVGRGTGGDGALEGDTHSRRA